MADRAEIAFYLAMKLLVKINMELRKTSGHGGPQSIEDARPADNGREPAEEDLPTLQLCAKAINARIEDRERRFRGLDTEAGLILGFNGLIVGVATQTASPGRVAIAGQAASALSGLFAAAVLICRRGSLAAEPEAIEGLAELAPWEAFTKISGVSVWAYNADGRWLKVRGKLLLGSAWSLAGALILLVVGTGLRLP